MERLFTSWKRFFGRQGRVVEPLSPTTGKQPTVPNSELPSLPYSNRQMVISHLRANPEKQEEMLKDPDTFGEFLSFWLLEFSQRVDTGKIENLLAYIKTADPTTLPRDLQKAKKEIFVPLFKLLNGRGEGIFSKVRTIGLGGVSRLLGQTVISSEGQLPNSLKNQYLEYVGQLVRLEAGITAPKPAETQNQPLEKTSPCPASPPAIPPSPESPPPKEVKYSYFIVLGPNSEPSLVKNPEELSKRMKKINGLSQTITPEVVWRRLINLSEMPPMDIMRRYGERVAGGPFKGWYEIRIERKWLIIFSIEDSQVLFRVGSHEDVYATRRRKSRDQARSF